MRKMKFQTNDVSTENINKIASIFPSCITETKKDDGTVKHAINFQALRQILSSEISDEEEHYEFTWVGKKASIVEANKPTTKTLRPLLNESRNWDSTRNLFIEGDNLEVLKLLQESYLGKVKMIYIDPPYNTGHDFVYPDSFIMDNKDYNDGTGYFDEEGNINFKRENTVNAARYHSDWCSMIYPRIMLSRNLLSDDGAIFISIDDNEASNLVKICDEIFGEHNRVTLICHKSRASISNDKIISSNHNIVLFYAKNIATLEQNRKLIGLEPDLSNFELDDCDGRGPYRLVPVDGPGGAKKGNPYYEFLGIKGYWRFSKETMQEKFNNGYIVKKGNTLSQKYYKSTAEKTRRTATTWWDDAGLTSTATSRLKQLMGKTTFDTPKPIELIDRMLRMITFQDKDAIILDFFAGSCTTAHAVMQLNAEDNGNRQFIMIQLPEPCSEKSDAHKAGYKNICDIGKERIRRAGDQIIHHNPLHTTNLDTGFRVFKLDSSNMKDVYYSAPNLDQSVLFDAISNIKEDRTDLDLLFGCLLDWGVPLSMSHVSEQIEGFTVHTYNDGDLIACFDTEISEKVVTEIAKRKPLRAVFRDSCFSSSPAKINIFEIFKLYMPEDADDISKRVRVI